MITEQKIKSLEERINHLESLFADQMKFNESLVKINEKANEIFEKYYLKK